MMKKTVILFFTLFLSAIAIAQHFPGKAVGLLQNKELRVLPLTANAVGCGYKGFFKDPAITSMYKKGTRYTDARLLAGKVFKVVSYEPRYCNYVLKLDNPETGVLYYDYHSYSKEDFVFEVVGGLTFPDDHFCSGLAKTEKWISASKGYMEEIHTPIIDDIALYHTADGIYKLRVGLTLDNLKNKEVKGVTLYLENGEVLSFPDVLISTRVIGGKYCLITKPRIEIDAAIVEKLRNNKIVRKQVGDYGDDVAEGALIKEYIKCLTK